MKKLEYRVSFTTPAFLGNADQQAQWRTPPFKALLRQWWRVVHAPKVHFNVDDLRRDEGRLFGVAADGGDSRQSLVRFRLSRWQPGRLTQWQGSKPGVFHPEVGAGGMKVGEDLYLGYGPVTYETGAGTVFAKVKGAENRRSAISEGMHETLTLSVPDAYVAEIGLAMCLAAWFGTLGSRSRNGWGALHIEPAGDTPAIPDLTATGLKAVLRPLDQCLTLDWPHAIGTDGNRPLVWRTAPKDSWREVMKQLAQIKIAFRTQPALSFSMVAPGQFGARHLLGYPATHHNVNGSGWGNQGRLGNQLRFKVTKQDAQWQGVIVHLPCRLPAEMVAVLPHYQRNNLDETARTAWRAVHTVLDQNANRVR
jgi:CRISPR-associated protein Cmr1